MSTYYDANHIIAGHIDAGFHQHDAQGVPVGRTEVHGDVGAHYDASHAMFASSERHGDGSMVHFDQAHRLVGTTEHHGDATHHYDAAHVLTGTDQHVGDQVIYYDANHVAVGSMDSHAFAALQMDLATAFQRLF